MDLDLTSTDPIRSDTPDEEPTPAAPILLTYTTEGTLIAYHVLNTMTPNYPNMLPFDASRIRDPSPSPAKVTTTVPTAASAATTLLPFGATSTSGPKPSFGFGASVPGFGSTGFGSTTPTVTPNKPAFGQPAFGSATPAFGTTPKATFGAPAFGTPTTTPAFGKPAFGQTSFGAATTTPAFTGFGGVAAQQTPFGQAGFNFSSTTPIQTPPTVGASGSGNAASRPAGSKVPGLDSPGPSPPATPVTKVPAPNVGTSGFGSFNPSSTTPTTTPSFSSAAAQTKLSGDILPSSGAFGQTSGATSAFGAFGNPSKRPEFSLPKSDTPASSTATPTFGSTTAFGSSGGFGSSSIPKPSASIQPVKVGAGGGFAGFGSSSGFGGFGPAATKAGTQNIFGGTSSAPPAIKVETSTSPTTAFSAGNGSKPFSLPSGPGAARGTKDTVEDDDEPDRLERFPESENENKEPTQTNLDFLSAPSRSVSAGASPSSFSFMSLGTARPQSQASTPGIQTAFAPATLSKSPQSAIPMSTTTTLFPGPITPTATSPARTPMQEEKPITPATDQDEVEESEDPTEDGEGEGEEAEEGQEEEEPFVVSAPQSSDEEEEGSGTDEEEEPSAGTDSSYVFAEAPKGRSPSADGNTTPRADRRSSPADSTTPVSSPVRPNPEPASSSLPSPPYGANRSEMPSVGFSFGRPNQGVRGKSPFPSAPAVSSPLANPPISGPSPTKSAAEQSEPPEAPFPSLFKQTGKAIQMPMPADDDNKKPATRPGTPPLLFGGGLSKPKPSTASGPSSESQTPALFGVPPSRIPVPKEAIKSSPDVGAPKPLFGSSSPSFSFGAVNSTPKPATSFAFGQAPPPVTSKSTPPPSGFVGFGQPITLGSTASTSLPSRIPVPLNATPAPQPKTPENDMEAMFVRTIDEMAENLDTLRKQVSEARARQLQLKHPKAPQSFNRDLGEAANWTFSDLRSVSSVALSLQTDIEIADKNIKEMMRQIALISTISQKTENQHEEIRRLLEAVRDPRTTELAYKRQLSPEQQGSQARLRYLYEIVKARVEQLELIVEGEKSKVERAKAGRTSIQVPTLELVTRSLKRVTTGAKARLEELESLQRRIEILAIAGDEPLNDSPKGIRQSPSVPPASLSISLPAVGPARTASFTSIKGKGARNSVDFEARAAAAAALHAETCASMLKDAMRVRATETAPWTRCTRVKESSGPSIRRGVTLRRPTQPRRSQMATHSTPDGPSRQTKSQILTTPNGSGSHGQTSSLFGRKSEASLFGSRVDSSPGLGIKPAPRPSLGSGPPPKIRPLSMPARRGYGMNFDDD
ncbi:hypothetical protein FRB90_008007 [Tulasnella sp. 427]|nr:hypothetical protein FRB90_008007 [Tulasnella sp. 427]